MSDGCPYGGIAGFYTVSIPIARAMVYDRRACPLHGPVLDGLFRDSATDRLGRVRDYLSKTEGDAVWLRPLDDGPEFTALVADLEPVSDGQGVSAAPVGHLGEFICPYCAGDSVEAQIAREVYGCTAGIHCVDVTPQQRAIYNARITTAVAEYQQEAQARA